MDPILQLRDELTDQAGWPDVKRLRGVDATLTAHASRMTTHIYLLRGASGENGCMNTAALVDIEAILRACERYHVQRLRVFGAALTDRFDPEHSDVDFLVDFLPGNDNLFHDYFDLKDELERILGRSVDLVDASAVRNPYFKASAFGSAQELYAA
jgi:predicted nucleotidyltransferase